MESLLGGLRNQEACEAAPEVPCLLISLTILALTILAVTMCQPYPDSRTPPAVIGSLPRTICVIGQLALQAA